MPPNRPNEPPCPDEPIKHHRPLHLMDEERLVIKKRIQYLRQLQTGCQTIENSSNPTLMSPEALQK